MGDQPTKTCTKCRQAKRLSDFHRAKGRKDGRYSVCKLCRVKTARKYRKANRENRREYDRKYHEAHPEKQREYSRKHYEAHREERCEAVRKSQLNRKATRQFCIALGAIDAIKQAAAEINQNKQAK